MPKKINLTGKQFTYLTVLYEIPERKNGKIYWHCKCKCGNECDVSGASLRDEHTKSCGCLQIEKNDEKIKNKKFGYLTPIEKTDRRDSNGGVYWKCQCDCGNICEVVASKLTNGNTSSCGCQRSKGLIEFNHSRIIDISNQKFGYLTALYPNGNNNNKSVVWHCICDCGNECDVSGHDLRTGNTKSCGCQRNGSFGEAKIKKILEDNNILYKKEYTPENYNNYKKFNFKPRFDFYLIELNTIIEFDGIQHFKQGTGNYDNEEKFNITQQHDKIKNQWCKDNNIPLIRIPYTRLDELTLEDLLIETSKYRIG